MIFLLETLTLSTNELIIIRLLEPADAPKLVDYFNGLSEQTKRYFAPHSFIEETVHHICNTLNPNELVRLIALSGDSQKIIAYTLLLAGATPSDTARFQALGIPVDTKTDYSIAPSVADAYQSRGLGGYLMTKALTLAKVTGKKRVILWGGVQARNERAVRYYRKYGFVELAQFEQNGVSNYDMSLTLA